MVFLTPKAARTCILLRLPGDIPEPVASYFRLYPSQGSAQSELLTHSATPVRKTRSRFARSQHDEIKSVVEMSDTPTLRRRPAIFALAEFTQTLVKCPI